MKTLKKVKKVKKVVKSKTAAQKREVVKSESIAVANNDKVLETKKVAKVKKVAVKPVEAKIEPLKKLPKVDGYQVIRVLEVGHNKTHLHCEAVSAGGDKVTIHVDRKLF